MCYYLGYLDVIIRVIWVMILKILFGQIIWVIRIIMKKDLFFKLLFILAILMVGIVYSALPHFVRYDTLKKEGLRYVPVTQRATFELMSVQAARYREMLDSSIFRGEVDTYEHRNGPAVWPILSAAMMAPFVLLTNSVFGGIIITDFVFPVLIFLSFFFILRALTAHSWFSLGSAYILMLFPQLPLLIPPSSLVELKILILQFLPLPIGAPAIDLTYLGRESFIPSGAFFIFALYFIYETVAQGTAKKYFTILAGIFYGLLFYLYLYFYVFTTIFLGIFFLLLLAFGRKQEALRVFFVGTVGLVVSIPFWISYYHLSHLPNYWEFMDRFGVEIGRSMKLFLWKTYLLFIAMAGGALLLGRKTNQEVREKETKSLWHYFIAALALSGIVAYNVNAIMGYFIQADHWSGRVFLITEGIIWATLLYYFIFFSREKFKFSVIYEKSIIILCLVVIASLMSNVVYTGISENIRMANTYTVSANLMDSYAWLNENTPAGSVIVSPSLETNIDVSVYSHNKILLARALTTLASDKELLDRLYITYKLSGISIESLDAMIKSFYGMYYFFTAKYNSREPDASLRPWKYPLYVLPDNVREEILSEYKNYKIPEKIPYRADYIFIGPKEREIGINEKMLIRFEKVYHKDNVQIYKWSQ